MPEFAEPSAQPLRSEPLAQLAQRYGIARSFHDVWGEARDAAPATLVALLGAMGVAAADDAQVQAAHVAHDAARWRRLLPPVVVQVDDAPAIRVPLHLSAGFETATLQWGIDEEGGARHRGQVQVRELATGERGVVDGLGFTARELVLPGGVATGYHTLSLHKDGVLCATCRLIVVPRRCYRPRALDGDGRIWGAAAQLYAVRSERNWGIGDFSDLAALTELWGRHGAGVVGVSPLHASFAHNPAQASPYSPSSRSLLNVLYLDVEAIDDCRESESVRGVVRSAQFQSRLQALRATELVDYEGVAAAKREVLELLFTHFQAEHLRKNSARAQHFGAWRAQQGEPLRHHALFEAMQEHFHRADPGVWGWPVWPEAFRHPRSPEVAHFAQQHEDRVAFYEYLQWQADLQLGAVGRRSYELGLGVGLYVDLAVSVDPAGSEAWAHQDLLGHGVAIGAPPDIYNLSGQDWGLPPYDPHRLRDAAYEPLITTLRANMRHAGALRIDHVMALMRLFWVPRGLSPALGAYVHYSLDDLLGIVALESQRNRCLVIGEDLGTVPDEVRVKLAASGVLSYKVLCFERDANRDFTAPAQFARQAIAAVSTHDLPTLAGWWQGRDLEVRASLGLFPQPQQREQQLVERAQDRARLLLALEREGLLPSGATANPVSIPVMTPAFCQAIHQYLARASACIAVAQLEDVAESIDQVNLPGTTDQYPNWRRKLTLTLERWPSDPRFIGIARLFERERGASPGTVVRRESLAAVVPRATYRVQLNREFCFRDATALVPYLARLGVSHLYCSPFLRARPGSRHGYDIVDHNQFNPEIGNRDDFEQLASALKQHDMGMLVDVVPNHMGVLGADNGWWMDVLENGEASLHAGFFDIDWLAEDRALSGRVLLPILGDQYGVVLERGELNLAFEPESGSFVLRYGEHRLPIDPALYPSVLSQAVRLLPPVALDAGAADGLASLMASLGHLPPRDTRDAEQRNERHRDKEVHKASLARLVRELPPLAAAIEQALVMLNGDVQRRSSFDALDALIEAQAYRLAYWRVAADEINYRRFFDINELAALRMEEPQVFDAAHRLILDLVATGRVDGLRIDHPDGLFDPAGYFRRLQERYVQLVGAPGAAVAAQEGRPPRPLYVVVEKILAPHEQLPRDWAVHGTTGYRFVNVVGGLFVDTTARSRLDRTWRAFVGDEARDFDALAHDGRLLVMGASLAGELTVLATALHRLARADRRTRDFTQTSLRSALAEVVANFPVYRTYIVEGPRADDRRFIAWAVARARSRSSAADASVFHFIQDVLLGKPPADDRDDLAAHYLAFSRRFQQFTSPVAAKGIEDTAFYRHHRLSALNEVGGEPDDFGITVRAFHGASRDRARSWPHTMLATSTHDTKRSEDVRARLVVLSEMPAAWRLSVRRWSRWNRSLHREVDGVSAPARNDEYLLYQTLVGTCPVELDERALAAYRERIDAYMRKVVREAKQRSGWVTPNQAYESALSQFVAGLLGRVDGNAFLDDLRGVAASLAWYGALNGIAMAAIKFTSPGVPDLYQGEEMIELALVDPDNRRPVDFAARNRALEAAQALAQQADFALPVRQLLPQSVDGRAKLWTVWRALQLRRDQPKLFEHGDYRALAVQGTRAHHALAYARCHQDGLVVLVAGRLFASMELTPGELPLGAIWGDTAVELSPIGSNARLTDVLSGTSFDVDPHQPLPLAQLLAHFPVAILHGRAQGT